MNIPKFTCVLLCVLPYMLQGAVAAPALRRQPQADTLTVSSASSPAEGSERNVMLNASDANKPREIQIGLPSEDVNVYENGLPAVYSSTVHRLAAHWRSDSGLSRTTG